MKPTLVIGASDKPDRYAYKAIMSLRNHEHEVIALGKQAGKVADIDFQTEWNSNWEVDTVTLYLNPTNQEPYLNKIIDLKPNRVIFNPGTENPSFIKQLQQHGIMPEIACTLVMLSIGNY